MNEDLFELDSYFMRCGAIENNIIFLVSSPAIKKLEIVECDLEKPDQIGPALGNASIVICCIGASEKEIFDVTGPYRIDYLATKNLIDAGKEGFGWYKCFLILAHGVRL